MRSHPRETDHHRGTARPLMTRPESGQTTSDERTEAALLGEVSTAPPTGDVVVRRSERRGATPPGYPLRAQRGPVSLCRVASLAGLRPGGPMET